MSIRIVQSKQNARLKELRRALSSPGRNESGLAGIEGPNLLAEAVRAGLHIACVFVAQGSERLVEALRLPERMEVLAMPRELLDAALTQRKHRNRSLRWWSRRIGPGHMWLAIEKNRGADSGFGRAARPGKPGNDCAVGRGVWRRWGGVSAGNRERVESQGRAGVGGKRVSGAGGLRERERCSGLAARGWREDSGDDGAGGATGGTCRFGGTGGAGDRERGEWSAGGFSDEGGWCGDDSLPGPVESLNAAVAASVLLYEAARQRAAEESAVLLNGAEDLDELV